MKSDESDRNGLIRAGDLQENLQQACTFGLLLRFGCASVSIISSYLPSIRYLFIYTCKPACRTSNPKVAGSSPTGCAFNLFHAKNLHKLIVSITPRFLPKWVGQVKIDTYFCASTYLQAEFFTSIMEDNPLVPMPRKKAKTETAG